jgi:hypothetical protein
MGDIAAPDDLVARAKAFAIAAHRRIDHRRKYNQQPYEVHLKAVAELVATVSDDAEMLAAAWLHDIVEDTEVTLEQLDDSFGPAVARLVYELTDVSRPGDGNRAARKAIDRQHLAQASPRAQTVKLADLCDNAADITRGDPKFAGVFLAEMRDLLDVLRQGNERLQGKARRMLARCERQLARSAAVPVVSAESKILDKHALQSVRRQLEAFRAVDVMHPVTPGRKGMPLPPRDQQLKEEDTLSTVVHVLTRHELACVVAHEQRVGQITRSALEQPIGRMWIFGMLTLIELDFTARIRRRWPFGGWEALISPGRLDVARTLLGERSRTGATGVDLLDCLQLVDKGQVLIQLDDQRAEWGFRTLRMAKAAIKDLASLRNHLMHAQPLVGTHWTQIARLAHRFDEILAEHVHAEGRHA